MAIPLVSRAERSLADFLDTNLTGVTVFDARSGAARAKPHLEVRATGFDLAEGMPAETGTFAVTMTFELTWAAGANHSRPSDLDDALATVESCLFDLAAVQAHVNKPAGTDNRVVTGFHLQDLILDGSSVSTEDNDWIETLNATVICLANDA